MFNKNVRKRKNRLKRLKSIKCLISRKGYKCEKVIKLKGEANTLLKYI